MAEYVHELPAEVRFLSGGYEMEREGVLDVDGESFLYVVGHAVVDSACCGTWGCRFALVPGAVRNHKGRRDAEGRFVSEVERVRDPALKARIERMLKEREQVQQVRFVE